METESRIQKTVFPSLAFTIILALHLLYFKVTEESCGSIPWFQKYINEQEYFLGISYALSFGFMTFAFLKFKENRISALRAAFGGGIWAIILWFACFLFGCCGSPMLVVYLNLIGLSKLKVPKFVLLMMTLIFIAIGYIWLMKKSPKGCCNGRPCKEDEK